ncbi:major facilitator superfamily domain-containing protein [Aspergillus cavernicola]|uniref:Major facilitator superfamily domain-containing protein n=1 Tax=Aspergillus cavernicola TaxID=176166 RepID=A0ABR4HUB1_9EURO
MPLENPHRDLPITGNEVDGQCKKVDCFLSFLLIIPAISNSKQHVRAKKWILTSIASLSAAAAPLGSTILMPALPQIATDLHTTRTTANLSIAFYALSMAIIPLWWSTISEMYGRRPVYIVSFILFLVCNILSALSTSIAMFIDMRVLAGGASASVQAVGAGTIADLWEVKERGKAMGIFFLGPMLGPLLAPIIGGAVTQKWGWRSTQWAMVIYGVVVLVLMVICMPETSGSFRHNKTAEVKVLQQIQRVLVDPFKIVRFIACPPILITVYYASVTFASYYFLNISIQSSFSQPPYSFSPIILGLMYIPSALGSVAAAMLGGRWSDYIMRREAAAAGNYEPSGELRFRPADRMKENAWIAGLLYPAAMLCYGWTVDKHVFWLVPCITNFFFGFGNNLIFNMATTMLTEFIPNRASTGVALNNLFRNLLSCVTAIVTEPLIVSIGNGWLFTIVSFICWLSMGVILIMKRRANQWAEEMGHRLL